MNDQDGAFGWPFTITDPAGTSAPLVGRSSDISQVVDPDTGVVVSGRLAHVSVMIEDLTDASLGLPVGIADTAGKPWLVVVDDINGVSGTFKVAESNPDRALGIVVLLLEAYK
jgi:hypothetical protein